MRPSPTIPAMTPPTIAPTFVFFVCGCAEDEVVDGPVVIVTLGILQRGLTEIKLTDIVHSRQS